MELSSAGWIWALNAIPDDLVEEGEGPALKGAFDGKTAGHQWQRGLAVPRRWGRGSQQMLAQGSRAPTLPAPGLGTSGLQSREGIQSSRLKALRWWSLVPAALRIHTPESTLTGNPEQRSCGKVRRGHTAPGRRLQPPASMHITAWFCIAPCKCLHLQQLTNPRYPQREAGGGHWALPVKAAAGPLHLFSLLTPASCYTQKQRTVMQLGLDRFKSASVWLKW